MVAKFGEARRRAFLKALRETGNQTLAAERAKVSLAWVKLHRSSDPAFRRATEEAVADAAERLGGRLRPLSSWGFLDGHELVVRGTGGAGGAKRVQVARARVKQWSPRVEERFLSVLASTCNVRAASAAVGMHSSSAYDHRRRWPGFAERWRAAVEMGYLQLECGLNEAAGNFHSGEGLPDAAPLTGMTTDQAIHLLHMHKHAVLGIGKPQASRAREPDIEDIRAEILRKVEALKRHDSRRLEKDRKEWARRRVRN
jgi:hypothetical protein